MQVSALVDELISAQLVEWELAKINYAQLSRVRTREIDFGEYKIFVQFNPERIRSSAARVDAKAIEARPCFLCRKNRPSEQRGVPFGDDMTILVNPFPIFSRHLTIPCEVHTVQRIFNNFSSMLNLAQNLPGFVVFYNGPECGASAPDHLHFQAGNRGFLSVETDFLNPGITNLVSKKDGVEIWNWSEYMRGMITLTGSDIEKLEETFKRFFSRFSLMQPGKPEPMINLIAYYEANRWIIHLIPRKAHRPSQFFRTGEEQILMSPASVDLAGVIITPREEDYNKISAPDIVDMFVQVCYKESELSGILGEII
jgi:hypothetical protein